MHASPFAVDPCGIRSCFFSHGTTVKTRFGKLGASGQMRVKDCADKAAAQAELESQVAKKVKEGYEEGGGGGASDDGDDGAATGAGGPDARNAELEAGIIANPYDASAWMVLADWLQDQGDLRGELIALQTANKTKPAKALFDKHKAYFLGPLEEHQKCYDSYDLKSATDAFTWRSGYIFKVRLSHNHYANEEFKGSLKEVLQMLLDHPSGRFITEMAFQDNNDPNDDDLQDLIDLLAKKAPKTIRKLEFGDEVDQISWYNVGNLSKLWKAVPNLHTLQIEAGSFTLGKIEAPNLKKAVFITGGLGSAEGKSIATAQWPKIEHLEVYFGDENYGGDCTIKQVQPLLDRTDLTKLQYLGLKNSEFANDIARALPKAKILKGLKKLDLSMGIMTDEGAEYLAAHKDAFKHLEEIDLSENYISDEGAKLLKGLCKKVTGLNAQKDDDDPEYRNVSVGE